MSEETSSLTLSDLSPTPGSTKRRKRLGVGEGSGKGKTCGKGQKGQRSRSGYKAVRGFEGGQMPLHRRLPKVGFTSRMRLQGKNIFSVVSLSQLETLNSKGEVTLEVLKEAGLIRKGLSRVKILGGTEAPSKLIVEAHAASRSAKEAIEKAGGELRIVGAAK